MAQIKDKVIVLKKVKYGESDLILHCLNSHGVRLHFMAKGALRSKKRFGGGVLEPTHYISVSYKEKKSDYGSDVLHFLEEAQVIEEFAGLRTDYDRLELALYFVGLISQVSQEGSFDEGGIFDLLGHALRAAQNSNRLDLLKSQFELKFLYQQGVLPPELAIKDFMARPVREHEQIVFGSDEFNSLKRKVQHCLSSYVGSIG